MSSNDTRLESILRDVVAGQREIVQTLQQPVVAKYDDQGRVIAAKREKLARPDTSAMTRALESFKAAHMQPEAVPVAILAALYALDDRLNARIGELTKRLAALETQQKHFGYVGTFTHGTTYQKNNFVTHASSLWACLRETTQVPGTSGDWQLAVKRPRQER